MPQPTAFEKMRRNRRTREQQGSIELMVERIRAMSNVQFVGQGMFCPCPDCTARREAEAASQAPSNTRMQ